MRGNRILMTVLEWSMVGKKRRDWRWLTMLRDEDIKNNNEGIIYGYFWGVKGGWKDEEKLKMDNSIKWWGCKRIKEQKQAHRTCQLIGQLVGRTPLDGICDIKIRQMSLFPMACTSWTSNHIILNSYTNKIQYLPYNSQYLIIYIIFNHNI